MNLAAGSEQPMSNEQKKSQPQRVAIVTGAATGIGAAIARTLQAAGYRVFGSYRKPPTTPTPGVEYVACDVTNDLAVHAAVRDVLARAGRIDLLVNNAGVGLSGAAEESSLEQADQRSIAFIHRGTHQCHIATSSLNESDRPSTTSTTIAGMKR
jgi:NAD(P)-dependent dehydrogenase (short-subunit alcohol dehydrogenase family)